ncbi:unnamed protein product [Microthlaspi erraticum]|uniref:Ankyrin repeat domain-containing protein n=1 Tax=Microthlaspi erraticum TaxID=1685480 RepID=A0A6D2HLP9_9BRAS|nr:unnamed protein product [Microthlaspi erraticum]
MGHEEHGGTWHMEAAQLDTQRKKGEAILKTSSTVLLDQPVEFLNSTGQASTRSSWKSNVARNRRRTKNGWLGGWRRKETSKQEKQEIQYAPANEKVSNLLGDSNQIKPGRHSVDNELMRKPRESSSVSSKTTTHHHHESEYKKGLRPVLWLSQNFKLQTEELLPLLDILANKVKAIRRLRELLTTKLPAGTFPVNVAIPVVPTIKVFVTFTKSEEIDAGDEFKTPPSSPTASGNDESPAAATEFKNSSWSSWFRSSRASKEDLSKRQNRDQSWSRPSLGRSCSFEKKRLELIGIRVMVRLWKEKNDIECDFYL